MDTDELREALTDPVARQLYDSVDLARLAYTGRDGAPRVIPMGYVWNQTCFVVCTATNAHKVRALKADPRVALTIDTAAFPPNVLLVRGIAAIEIVDGVPKEYLRTNRGRMTEDEAMQWEEQVRRLYKQMARIIITPTWAKVLDFKTRIPSAVEDLVGQHYDEWHSALRLGQSEDAVSTNRD